MKLLKKSVSILLTLTMMFGILTIIPFEASAASGISYICRSWDSTNQRVVDSTKTCSNYSTIGTQKDLTIGNGKWYVVNGDASISNRITVTGTANIILLSGTLTCKDGIRLSQGNTLNIYPGQNGSGTIEAKITGTDYANIGGNENESCGTLNFYGGTLNAKNRGKWTYAAAIGGGEKGGAGNLNFYGGKVTVTNYGIASAKNATGAAIGSGGFEENKAPAGCINIYGGEIEASSNGNSTASAIGGGEESKCPPINILGGKVTAKGSEGAGIGAGQEGISDTITIRNATVDAEGNLGAAIGSGEECDSGRIIIEGSYINAKVNRQTTGKGNEGAAIGGGNSGSSTYIKIDKSIVNAYSSQYGAGIGGGDEGSGGTIEITDSNVFACSGRGGAGIGGGDEKGCDSITIKRSYVVATTASEINTALKRFLNSYGDKFNTIALFLAKNPTTTEQAAVHAAGTLMAMLIDNLAEGTRTGAGIGSGHDGTVKSILIEDSIVAATGGEGAAGIGGGIGGSFDTINIKNSSIHASSDSDGAGIGSGESGKCGTINITDNSIVIAHGGAFGAGIGGGDDSDCGTVKINHSSVSAYGGEDGAGIGGGEDGDGGHIKIVNHSDVYAKGDDCGAGIGGGEDSDGEYCQIVNGCTVEAISGGYGNAQSIGHGDCGWYIPEYTGGTLSLGRDSVVYAGSNSGSTNMYCGKDRFDAVWKNKYAKVTTCPHHASAEWVSSSIYSHTHYCTYCGELLAFEEQDHIWDSNYKCTVCGASATLVTVSFIETNSSGNKITKTITVPKYTRFTMPECENAPDGKEFVCWKIGSFEYRIAGENRFADDLTCEAVYLPVINTSYIDVDGTERTVMARALDETCERYALPPGWYVANNANDYEYTWGFSYSGEVNLIIPDGKIMKTIPAGAQTLMQFFSWIDNTSLLSIYGQRQQTGTLNIGNYHLFTTDFNQYGGRIISTRIDEFGGNYSTNITRGTMNSNGCYYIPLNGTGAITGGNTSFNNAVLCEELLLGWTNLTDSFLVKGNIRVVRGDGYDGGIRIADGQKMTDGTNIYSGTLTEAQIKAIQGKTLKPYVERSYNAPEWKWDNEYREATAVFRSKDGSDVQEIMAKATYEDSGNNRKVTARCTFFGQEYQTTQTFRIIFDVAVKSTEHGTVTANKTSAVIGDNIKLEITADDGYTLSELYYTDSKGKNTVIEGSNFAMPESNVTVHAVFSEKYTVTWKNGDTVLEIDGDVPYGAVPSYDGTTPTKADNENDAYLFTGWSPEISKVTGDITYTAQFAQAVYVDESEPYIDENGEYILGHKAHYELGGKYYAANKNRTVGEQLDSIVLSYFDFKLLDNDTYQINYYTGPTDSLTELVIPKTFGGKPVTVLGNDITQAGNEKCRVVPQGTPAFTLVLNENITEIKPYSFYAVQVTTVTGNTSNLSNIGSYAFSWANSGGGYALNIKLDYPGKITAGYSIFNNMNVTARIKHETTFSKSYFGQQSIGYVFTDAHTYGEPAWDWDEDYIGATVTRTCTHPNCKHTESVLAEFIVATDEDGIPYEEAVAKFSDAVYHDVQPVYKTEAGGYIVEITGRFKGGVDSGKHNLVDTEGFRVVFKDKNGNKVTPPQYIWIAQESVADGVVVEPNGDIAFTQEGDFHVQLRSPDGKTIYSSWIPVRAFRGGDDGLSDSVDNSSSTVNPTENNVPKTGDFTSFSAVAGILLTSLMAVLFLAVKRRRERISDSPAHNV